MVGTDATMTSNVLSLQAHAVRSGEGFCADHQCGREHHLPRGECRSPDQDRCRRDRLREEESRQARLRLVRRRLAASSLRRAAASEDRDQHHAHSLQGRRRGGERSARRSHRHGVPQPVGRGAAHEHRQDPHRGGGGENPLRRAAGHSDGRRDRAGLRDVVLGRRVRAGRHAAGRSSQSSTRRWPRCSRPMP